MYVAVEWWPTAGVTRAVSTIRRFSVPINCWLSLVCENGCLTTETL